MHSFKEFYFLIFLFVQMQMNCNTSLTLQNPHDLQTFCTHRPCCFRNIRSHAVQQITASTHKSKQPSESTKEISLQIRQARKMKSKTFKQPSMLFSYCRFMIVVTCCSSAGDRFQNRFCLFVEVSQTLLSPFCRRLCGFMSLWPASVTEDQPAENVGVRPSFHPKRRVRDPLLKINLLQMLC